MCRSNTPVRTCIQLGVVGMAIGSTCHGCRPYDAKITSDGKPIIQLYFDVFTGIYTVYDRQHSPVSWQYHGRVLYYYSECINIQDCVGIQEFGCVRSCGPRRHARFYYVYHSKEPDIVSTAARVGKMCNPHPR